MLKKAKSDSEVAYFRHTRLIVKDKQTSTDIRGEANVSQNSSFSETVAVSIGVADTVAGTRDAAATTTISRDLSNANLTGVPGGSVPRQENTGRRNMRSTKQRN